MDCYSISIGVLFCFIEACCDSFWVSKAFFETLFDAFEASLDAYWASWDSLGGLLEPLGAILGRLGAKLGGLGAFRTVLRSLLELVQVDSVDLLTFS